MFEAHFESGLLLKALVDAIQGLVAEGNIDCTQEGIKFQAMDSSHVSLVSLQLDSGGFDNYRCERSMTLGISMGHLWKVVKNVQKEDQITLSHAEESDVVHIKTQNATKDRTVDTALKLMDIEQDSLGIPDHEYKSEVKLPSKEFQAVIRDISNIGEVVNITVNKESIKFSASGEIGTSTITLLGGAKTADDDPNVEIKCPDEPISLNFAVKYLVHFAKASGLGSPVVLRLSKEHPLVVEYPIQGFGHMRYYLAPKVDEDNEGEEEAS